MRFVRNITIFDLEQKDGYTSSISLVSRPTFCDMHRVCFVPKAYLDRRRLHNLCVECPAVISVWNALSLFIQHCRRASANRERTMAGFKKTTQVQNQCSTLSHRQQVGHIRKPPGNASCLAAFQSFFSFLLFKGAQAFCVILPTNIDGLSHPDAAFSGHGARH